MIKIDVNFLESVGLADLPKALHGRMFKHMYDTLEAMTGAEIADGMSSSQLAEFDALPSDIDKQAKLQWLESVRPDYKDVEHRNMESLKKAIRLVSEQILLDEGKSPSSPRQNPDNAKIPDNSTLRAWAADNGFEVSRFGRIPRKVSDAYLQRNQRSQDS